MSSLNSIVLTHSNIRTVCRVCLENKPNQLPLFTRIQPRNEKEFPIPNSIPTIVNDMLQKVTSELIQEKTSYPRQICKQCLTLLKSAYAFKLKFEESTNLLTLFLDSVGNKNHHTIPQVTVDNFEPHLVNNTSRIITANTAAEELDCIVVEDDIADNIPSNNCEDTSEDESICTMETYPCPMCTADLPTSLELRKHFHTHKGVSKYLNIGKTKKKVKFFAEPQNNLSIFNRKKILHKCPQCDKDFSGDQFVTHLNNHEQQEQFNCDKCGRGFKTRMHLNTHRLKHSNKYPYWCDKCNKGYIVKETYEYHLLLHTVSSTELPLQCSYCPKRFSNPKYLYRHQLLHRMRKDIKIYCCSKCPENFTDPNKLENHDCKATGENQNHISHSSAIRKEECKTDLLRSCRVCGKYSTNLGLHMKIHEKRQLCDLCGKRFHNKSLLQKHKRVHTGEKPFRCDLCEKLFPTNQQLKRHLKRMHVGLPRYMCSICGKSFDQWYLKVHEKSHEETNRHPCHVCNKSFDFNSKLQRHIKKFHECAE